jgi:hypothetical protein
LKNGGIYLFILEKRLPQTLQKRNNVRAASKPMKKWMAISHSQRRAAGKPFGYAVEEE